MINQSTQTHQLIKIENKQTETEKKPCKAIQTSNRVIEYNKMYLENIQINLNLIDLIINELKQSDEELKYFNELDDFRQNEKIDLIHFKTSILPTTDKTDVIDLIGGENLEIAILYGEKQHDSWCQHINLGRVVIYNKLRFLPSVDLPNCPVVGSFTYQNDLLIGTASGELFLIDEDKIIWSSDLFHKRCVTAIYWTSKNHLLTADGKIVYSILKTNNLEILKSIRVEINDLPLTLKRLNLQVKNREVGLVGISGYENEIFIASETGVMWLLDLKNFKVKELGYETNGIEQFVYISTNTQHTSNKAYSDLEYFIIQTPHAELRKKSKKFFLNSVLLHEEFLNQKQFCLQKKTNLLLTINENGETIGIDLNTNKIVLQSNNRLNETPNFEAITLCDKDSVFVGLSNNNSLNLYTFSNNF